MSKSMSMNLQDVFLNKLRRDRVPLTIYLTNGFQLKGFIKGFDNFVIVIETDLLLPESSVAVAVIVLIPVDKLMDFEKAQGEPVFSTSAIYPLTVTAGVVPFPFT